jgi:hypothetical protein
VPSKAASNSCKIKQVAATHEISEEVSSILMKNAPSLVPREENFIEVAYQHPRASIGVADIGEVIPKSGSQSGVGASVDACASGGGRATGDGEG